MAKKSVLERETKRRRTVAKYVKKRANLKALFKLAQSFDEKLTLALKIQKLPKNSAAVRLRNRCWKTGRPRGYYRMFGLCRNSLRNMASQGLLPGLTKSSW
jgi:small subunit ribosomal protein S14